MASVLFWLGILSVFGTLLIPLAAYTRANALLGWFCQLLGVGSFPYLRVEYFPSWQEPSWTHSIIWVVVSWGILIVGLMVAIGKPRKRTYKTDVA